MALGSRSLLNLGLALLVVVLALLAVYEPGKAPPKEPPRLLTIKQEEISQLRIERVNGPTIELARQKDGSWRMSDPLQIGVNDYQINGLLKITETESLSSFPARADALKQYGLDSPDATLLLNGTTRLEFGKSTPIDMRRYVRIGDTIHLINDNYYYHLLGVPTSYASNALLDAKASFSRLDLPGLSLTQQDGKWSASPAPAGYSVDQVTQLLDHWRHAQALEVKQYDGKKGEQVRITLKESDQPILFLVTERKPELILARPDLKVQYHLPQSSAADLLTLQPLPKEEPPVTPPTPAAQK